MAEGDKSPFLAEFTETVRCDEDLPCEETVRCDEDLRCNEDLESRSSDDSSTDSWIAEMNDSFNQPGIEEDNGNFCGFGKTVVQKGIAVGKGGSGTVYLGVGVDDGRLYAVKEIPALSKSSVCALKKEVELFSQLHHPNIVKQFGFDYSKSCCRLFMEYVPAGTVSSVLRHFGKLEEPTVRKYIKQLLDGLHFLHTRNPCILHRDIKPSNLLLSTNGTIKLSDFGISKILSDPYATAQTNIMGTPPYMPWEACRGEVSLGIDIWAVGCTIIELGSGKPPWSEKGNLDTLQLLFHIGQNPGDHPKLPPGWGEVATDFIHQCFAEQPADRPSAAALVKHDFIALGEVTIGSDASTLSTRTASCVLRENEIDSWVQYKADKNSTAAPLAVSTASVENFTLTSYELHVKRPSQNFTAKELDCLAELRVLYKASFVAKQLATEFPPQFTCANKEMAYRWAVGDPADPQLEGKVVISRWGEMVLPVSIPSKDIKTRFVKRKSRFEYNAYPESEVPPDRVCMQWWMNFANQKVFNSCMGPIFRQDEQQVMSHPALYAVRQMLTTNNSKHEKTLAESDAATPILFRGVQRKLHVKSQGLYGPTKFGAATKETVQEAVSVIEEPTETNIVAIAAPSGGNESSKYTMHHISAAFNAAYTAFMATRLESINCIKEKYGPEAADKAYVVVNTGNWGTGAFGGDKVLLALLQLLAAEAARIDCLVFHTFDNAFELAEENLKRLHHQGGSTIVSKLLYQIECLGFHWQ